MAEARSRSSRLRQLPLKPPAAQIAHTSELMGTHDAGPPSKELSQTEHHAVLCNPSTGAELGLLAVKGYRLARHYAQLGGVLT